MYDVVIIGAGSAGLAARKEISRVTSNYLVVDSGPLGTTCARVGCMPSKVLIEAADIFAQTKKLSRIGILPTGATPDSEGIDGKALMRHVRSLRDKYVGHVLGDIEKWKSTHFKAARATLTSKECMNVGFEKIQSKKFILATGSRPTMPKAWKDIEGLLTTDTFFEIEDLPKSLVVIGTGAIGLEMSHALCRLGVHVTAIGELKKFAQLSDPKIKENAIEFFSGEFDLIDGQVDRIEKSETGYIVQTKDKTISAEAVLVAMGRTPNLEDLGLEMAGATLSEKGMPKYSKTTFRMEGTNGYLVGDVNAERPILHEAVDQGRIAAQNATGANDQEVRQKTRLSIIFTIPNIAVIGHSFQQLTQLGTPFLTGSVSFKNQGRAVAKLENEGSLSVYGDPVTGKILGAELFAPGGEHLAHLIAWAMEANRTVFCLLAYPVYHPVLEEGLRTALMNLARQVENGSEKLRALRCDEAPADSTLV